MSSKPVKARCFAALAGLCVTLCGCMAPRVMVMRPENPPLTVPPSISPPPVVPPPPLVPPPISPPPQPEPMQPAAITAVPPAMLMPEPLPMEAMALRRRLGNPDFVRREMETELWRYDVPSCAVFFFMQQEGGMLRVRYTETLPKGMNMAADPACISALEQRVESGAPMVMSAPAAPP